MEMLRTFGNEDLILFRIEDHPHCHMNSISGDIG
jgi:hypothetical protein